MWEITGQITFSVAVLVDAIAEVIIAVVANMLTVHALVRAFNLLPALIAEAVVIVIIAIAYFLPTLLADMLIYRVVRTVDNSVASVAVVILVIIYVLTNELMTAFVAISVVIIIAAPNGDPYSAPVTYVIPIIVGVVGVIRIFTAFSFLPADVASCVFILVDVIKARQLITALIAVPVSVSIYTYVRHPEATFVTVMITVIIDMRLAQFLHTVSRSVALLTSSVIVPVEAIVAQPKTASVAEMIMVVIFVLKIIFLIAPVEIF